MTSRPERTQGLGRGLASLIPQRTVGQPTTIDIPVSRIRPNPHQPRKRFGAEELASLTESISEHGVLQPILVTETVDGFQLVAGERRLRAAQAAGLDRVPADVHPIGDLEQIELSAVENVQREELDPLETTGAHLQMIAEIGVTHAYGQSRVGKAL